MNKASNVSTGKPKITGAIWRAPFGTTLPTDAVTALDAAFKCVGYIAEDGVENEDNIETDSYKAWGGDVVIVFQTEKTDTFAWSMIETLNVDVLKAYYGDDNVTGSLDDGIVVRSNAADMGTNAWVIDLNLRGAVRRIVIPQAAVSEKGTITYKDDEVVAYPMTVTAEAYEGYDGDTHREYTKKAV